MDFVTNRGESLSELAKEEKVLLIFLRHFGCTFCRETLSDIAKVRQDIESKDVRIVLVHMVNPHVAQEILSIYGLQDLSHISDQSKSLYRRFGINKITFKSLFGFKNWWRAFVAGLVKGHLVGKPAGDPYQMPGVVLYHKQKVINNFVYKYISDRPDFTKIAQLA